MGHTPELFGVLTLDVGGLVGVPARRAVTVDGVGASGPSARRAVIVDVAAMSRVSAVAAVGADPGRASRLAVCDVSVTALYAGTSAATVGGNCSR